MPRSGLSNGNSIDGCVYRTKSDPVKEGHPNKNSLIISEQIRTPADGRKTLLVYSVYMSEQTEENWMDKGKKKKSAGKVREKKKKVLKVGGLWVDSLSFPAFDNEKDLDSPS